MRVKTHQLNATLACHSVAKLFFTRCGFNSIYNSDDFAGENITILQASRVHQPRLHLHLHGTAYPIFTCYLHETLTILHRLTRALSIDSPSIDENLTYVQPQLHYYTTYSLCQTITTYARHRDAPLLSPHWHANDDTSRVQVKHLIARRNRSFSLATTRAVATSCTRVR